LIAGWQAPRECAPSTRATDAIAELCGTCHWRSTSSVARSPRRHEWTIAYTAGQLADRDRLLVNLSVGDVTVRDRLASAYQRAYRLPAAVQHFSGSARAGQRHEVAAAMSVQVETADELLESLVDAGFLTRPLWPVATRCPDCQWFASAVRLNGRRVVSGPDRSPRPALVVGQARARHHLKSFLLNCSTRALLPVNFAPGLNGFVTKSSKQPERMDDRRMPGFQISEIIDTRGIRRIRVEGVCRADRDSRWWGHRVADRGHCASAGHEVVLADQAVSRSPGAHRFDRHACWALYLDDPDMAKAAVRAHDSWISLHTFAVTIFYMRVGALTVVPREHLGRATAILDDAGRRRACWARGTVHQVPACGVPLTPAGFFESHAGSCWPTGTGRCAGWLRWHGNAQLLQHRRRRRRSMWTKASVRLAEGKFLYGDAVLSAIGPRVTGLAAPERPTSLCCTARACSTRRGTRTAGGIWVGHADDPARWAVESGAWLFGLTPVPDTPEA